RIEALYLFGRAMPFAQWRERYLDHPLLTGLVRRLIWRFDRGGKPIAGLPQGSVIRDASGQAVADLDDSRVTLWHPLNEDADRVLGWRRYLAAQGVTQPFKQAHREVYVITDAERSTDVYSNRFAGHILRQHQFKALCDQRGWRYHLMGNWD